ncbi:hypothetical protein QQ045_000188 [Rhodiola kirilowii]
MDGLWGYVRPRDGIRKFFCDESYGKQDKVMGYGVKRPLVLKPWSPDENYELETVNALPVWVRFSNLNLHMRSKEILSMIASTMGKPIRTDGDVCIKGPRGTDFIQKVEYEWLPKRCSHCQSFGHMVVEEMKFKVLIPWGHGALAQLKRCKASQGLQLTLLEPSYLMRFSLR